MPPRRTPGARTPPSPVTMADRHAETRALAPELEDTTRPHKRRNVSTTDELTESPTAVVLLPTLLCHYSQVLAQVYHRKLFKPSERGGQEFEFDVHRRRQKLRNLFKTRDTPRAHAIDQRNCEVADATSQMITSIGRRFKEIQDVPMGKRTARRRRCPRGCARVRQHPHKVLR
ncbi:hypothetical protein NFJ02_31g79840 [Pycnococcus provasolii]